MERLGIGIAGFAVATIGIALLASSSAYGGNTAMDAAKAPVLVELFTSEGCSSCPPADQLLSKIEKSDPDTIVLSEHVTYWNGIGWRDPFSSRESTERQSDYVERMQLNSSYTPQMVVGGRYEFVGSDASAAASAIRKAAQNETTPITISDLQADGNHVSFSVETGTPSKTSQLLLVVAQDEGTQHVSNGENGGRTLRHVQIARSIRQIAQVKGEAAYKGKLSVDLPQPVAGNGWHIVVFLQQGTGGPILGAASHPV